MQNGDNYLKDGCLLPPERPRIHGLSATRPHRAIQYMQITLKLALERYRYRVSVLNRYLQYRYRNDTKKVSSPIPDWQGTGRAAVIDRLCVALAVNQAAVNCQTNSMLLLVLFTRPHCTAVQG